MAYLTENLHNSKDIMLSFQQLATYGAGILFFIEGTFLGIMVFSGNKIKS